MRARLCEPAWEAQPGGRAGPEGSTIHQIGQQPVCPLKANSVLSQHPGSDQRLVIDRYTVIAPRTSSGPSVPRAGVRRASPLLPRSAAVLSEESRRYLPGMEDHLIDYISRRGESQGSIAWLRVPRDKVQDRRVKECLLQFPVLYGVISGSTHWMFQISPGNLFDFMWFVESYMQPHAQLMFRSDHNELTLWTWKTANYIHRVGFRLPLSPDTITKASEYVHEKVKVACG